jgi:hypothetical protein
MQISILSFIFFCAKLWFFEWRHKNNFSEILNGVFCLNRIRSTSSLLFLFFVLIFDFLNFIVKILPSYISSLFLVRRTKGFLPLNNGELLFFHGFFLLQESQNIGRLFLEHGGKIGHSMLCE